MATDVENGFESENQEADQVHPSAAASSPPRPPCLAYVVVMPVVIAFYIVFGVGMVGFIAFSFVFAISVFPIIIILTFSLPVKVFRKGRGWYRGEDDKSKGGQEIEHMYNKSRWREKKWLQLMSSPSRILARASLLMLVWLVLSFSVERLKAVEILGSPMWKWSLLGVALTAAWFFVAYPITIVVFTLQEGGIVDETTQYYAAALLRSMVSTFYFGMFLAAWKAYFSTSHGLRQGATPNHQAFEFVTWTSISLLVGSLLWMFKDILMAKWRADAIYRRFEPRIFITALKYFFIGYCAAGFYQGRFVDLVLSSSLEHNGDEQPKGYTSKLHNASGKMGLTKLAYVSNVLTSLVQIMTPLLDRDNNEEEVVAWFNQQINDTTPDLTCTPVFLEKLFHSGDQQEAETVEVRRRPTRNPSWWGTRFNKYLDEQPDKYKAKPENKQKLANVLFGLVREEFSSTDFTSHDLKIWMVDAHKDCTNMGRTLADANKMVNCLDIFMSCVIAVIVLFLWLLITGVSSTTVLFTVATPFLALTFIFGDTAKTFFQGLIFCFCTHPFDVGDRCIFDDTELEVKNVSILTTTFMKIGSKEKKLYPNTVLASKAIVNFGWQPDPRDTIVLTLELSTNMELLETKIKEILTMKKSLFNEHSLELTIEEVGDINKVKIQFTHVLTVHDLSHNQCFKKKSKQRTIFMKEIKKYIQESRTGEVNQSKYNQLPMNEIKETA